MKKLAAFMAALMSSSLVAGCMRGPELPSASRANSNGLP